MQQTIKQPNSLRWLAIIVFAATIMVACNEGETKTETIEVKTDSMPALDKDTLSTTRPETIKNTSGAPQQQ